MPAAHCLQASCGPRPNIQVLIRQMLVCWRNWAGDTRLVLRNDFSMADTFHEPARLMVALRVLLVSQAAVGGSMLTT